MIARLQESKRTIAITSHRARNGFTLIELLVVIAVIGVITGLVISAGRFARIKAMSGRAHAELEQIAILLNGCFADNGEYPPLLDVIKAKLPGNVDITDPWERGYVYERGANKMSYSLHSMGPLDTIDADDIYSGRQ